MEVAALPVRQRELLKGRLEFAVLLAGWEALEQTKAKGAA
jgi:hypothetical protein